MLRLSICVGVLTLFGAILAENQPRQNGPPPPATGRLFFLEPLRQSYCRMFCTSADTMPYLVNLLCAVKCPELYLPHGNMTTVQNMLPTSPTITGTVKPSTIAETINTISPVTANIAGNISSNIVMDTPPNSATNTPTTMATNTSTNIAMNAE